MEDNSQSIISRSRQGMIKLVFAMPNKTLIGAQMICPRATDMIGEMATAIANGLTAKKLMLAMRAYPTYGEGIARAVENSGLLS
jgi:dihydrolipoamide dehydrogenase